MVNVGQRLKEIRLQKGLNLSDVSQSTRIRANFLEYIENGEYEKLPSATVAHGFVRNYISFLGLPEKETMAIFKREFDEEKIYKVLPGGMAKREDFPIIRMNFSKFILVAVLLFSLLVFLLFQYKDAIISPSVSIISPTENQVIKSTYVVVSGKTNPENVVYVNSFPVSVNDDGSFKKIISVFTGVNTVQIKIVNRFDKVTEKTIQVNVKM